MAIRKDDTIMRFICNGSLKGVCLSNSLEQLLIEKTDVRITDKVRNEIVEKLGRGSTESGGILGSTKQSLEKGSIDSFCFDTGTLSTENEYSPDIVYLNRILEEWMEHGICYCGMIHCHFGNHSLSYADIEYASAIMDANSMHEIYMYLLVLPECVIEAFRIRYKNLF